MGTLKVALVTDIHCGIDERRALGSHGLTLTKKFIKAANKIKPDLVVVMGDNINSVADEDPSPLLIELTRVSTF